jgi:U3 small nucleolar RNA-associated protein 13
MNQPGRLYNLFRDVATSCTVQAYTGDPNVDEVIRTLATSDLTRLLSYVRDWNSNAKTSDIAQRILFAVVKLRSVDDLMQAYENGPNLFAGDDTLPSSEKSGNTALRELIEAVIPYTERHLSKVDRLLQESYVIDYILGEMDNGMFDSDGIGNMEVDNTSG